MANYICSDHGYESKLIPAGVSKKTGEPYESFWACPEFGCKAKQVTGDGEVREKVHEDKPEMKRPVDPEARGKTRCQVAVAFIGQGHTLDDGAIREMEMWVDWIMDGPTKDEAA